MHESTLLGQRMLTERFTKNMEKGQEAHPVATNPPVLKRRLTPKILTPSVLAVC